MSVVGVGLDIVSIPEFAEQWKQPGTRFAEAFTAGERRDARSGTGGPERHLAARWAAKEAVIKAWSVSRFARRPAGDVGQPAAALSDVGLALSRNALAAALLSELADLLTQFAHAGFAPFQAEWEHWHAWQDEPVVVAPMQGEALAGLALGIDAQGALRLLTSDLVLDEPDDFDMADLPALTRLVHWAGLLGSRVLLSSATLPPALVEGLFLAYRAGRAVYQQHRSERPSEPVNICCLWIDEFHQTTQDCADGAAFREAHTRYVHKRVVKLQQAEVRRLAQIAPLPDTWHGMQEAERRKDFARLVLEQAHQARQALVRNGPLFARQQGDPDRRHAREIHRG